MKTYSKNNHQMCSIKKYSYIFSKIHRKTPVPESLFQSSLKPATLLKRDSGKDVFRWILRNIQENLFRRHHQVTASDIRMQVVLIYNLNLSLQFVTINFTFSLLQVFTLANTLMSLSFCIDLLFGRVILSHVLQDRF